MPFMSWSISEDVVEQDPVAKLARAAELIARRKRINQFCFMFCRFAFFENFPIDSFAAHHD